MTLVNTARGVVRECAGDRSGAVYVEFVIAFMPLMVMFSGLFQLGMLQIADVVTQHAAVTAARAAMVILPDNPIYYDTGVDQIGGQRYADIQLAAQTTLTAIDPSPQVQVRFVNTAGGSAPVSSVGQFDILHAQVLYQYACRIPIGSLLVCGPAAAKLLTAESDMPNQGANESY
jgi:Flp pilus assembly protein TadG